MKEAFMRERVGELEVELRGAMRRNAELEDDAKKVGWRVVRVVCWGVRV